MTRTLFLVPPPKQQCFFSGNNTAFVARKKHCKIASTTFPWASINFKARDHSKVEQTEIRPQLQNMLEHVYNFHIQISPQTLRNTSCSPGSIKNVHSSQIKISRNHQNIDPPSTTKIASTTFPWASINFRARDLENSNIKKSEKSLRLKLTTNSGKHRSNRKLRDAIRSTVSSGDQKQNWFSQTWST